MNRRRLAAACLLVAVGCDYPSGSTGSTGPSGPTTLVVETNSPATRGNALTEAIGIETAAGEFTPILDPPCPLPCEDTVSFSTFEDDQSEILIYVFRGNTSSTDDAHPLGVYEVRNLPPAPGGEPDIAVTFRATREQITLGAEGRAGLAVDLVRLDTADGE